MSSVRRAAPEVPFAQVGRGLLQDEALPIDTRGMLAFVLSLPGDWRVRLYGERGTGTLPASLQAACGVGRDRLQRMVREAVAAGYMTSTPARDEATGQMVGHEHLVHHVPVLCPSTGLPDTRAGRHSVHIEETLHRESLPPSPPEPPGPRSPAARNGRGRGRGKILDKLRAEGMAERVLALFASWLDHGLRWPDVHDPAAWARQLCEDLAGVPETRLAAVAEQLASVQRCRMPPAADILAAVEERG